MPGEGASRRYQDVAALAQALAPFGQAEARSAADRIGRVMRGTQASSIDLRAEAVATTNREPAAWRSRRRPRRSAPRPRTPFAASPRCPSWPARRSSPPSAIVAAIVTRSPDASKGAAAQASVTAHAAVSTCGAWDGVRPGARARAPRRHAGADAAQAPTPATSRRARADRERRAARAGPGPPARQAEAGRRAGRGAHREARRHERFRRSRLDASNRPGGRSRGRGQRRRPSAARAQSHNEDLARADSLFNAGKALLESGQNVDACAKFAESKRLAPGLGVTLYLADCYERIGRTASAWTEFRSAEGLARERSDKRADVARGRAQALEAKLNRLTITVAPTVPQSGLQILRDGAAVSSEEWGLAVPVDPGDHVVVVASPGHAQRTFPAHVGPEAPSATVRVDRLEDAAPAIASAPTPTPAPAVATPAPAPAPASVPARRSRRDAPLDWRRLAAAGVVGVALGAVFGLGAKSKLDSPIRTTTVTRRTRCDPTGLSLRSDASNAATLST